MVLDEIDHPTAARVLRIGAVTLVVVLAVVFVWNHVQYEAWPWPVQDTPDRLSFCGRDYTRGPDISTTEVRRTYGKLYRVLRRDPPLNPAHDVFSINTQTEPGHRDDVCTMGLYMRVGDHYVLYGIVGGP